MKVKENLAVTFFVLFTISLFLYLLKPTFLYSAFSFIRPYSLIAGFPLFNSSQIERLKDDNLALGKKIAQFQTISSENQALHDQFLTASPKSLSLLPSHVIGAPRFMPGLSLPEIYTLDVGQKDGVKVGNAVVFKDNLIGKIEKVTASLSQADLIVNPDFKLAAKSSAGTLGIVKGEGNDDIIFDNVLLSDKLTVGDLILTSGDLKIDSSGLPSGLVLGIVVSVEKNPSDIFQKAKIKSFLNFSRVNAVFVVTGMQ